MVGEIRRFADGGSIETSRSCWSRVALPMMEVIPRTTLLVVFESLAQRSRDQTSSALACSPVAGCEHFAYSIGRLKWGSRPVSGCSDTRCTVMDRGILPPEGQRHGCAERMELMTLVEVMFAGDSGSRQVSELQYFTHAVDGRAYGAWYRVLSSSQIEVVGVGLLDIVSYAGFSPENAAQSVLEHAVHERIRLGIPIPSLNSECDLHADRSDTLDAAPVEDEAILLAPSLDDAMTTAGT